MPCKFYLPGQAVKQATHPALLLSVCPPQGAYCWEVNVTASVRGDAATTNVTVGNTTTPTSITQWAADNTMTFSQPAVETYKVCFVKRTPQATAELTYDMCKTGKRECHQRHLCATSWSD